MNTKPMTMADRKRQASRMLRSARFKRRESKAHEHEAMKHTRIAARLGREAASDAEAAKLILGW